MIKKIDVLGLSLDNCTVREAMMRVEEYLNEGVLRTIETVTMQMLLVQEEDAVVREVLSGLDLTIIGEKEILQIADAASMQRVQETEENDFAYEFFKRVERNKKRVFLLGESEERLAQQKAQIADLFPRMEVCGECALEECTGDIEAVINEINAMSPDVILSVLPTPGQEHFLSENRDKMHVNLWYGMGVQELGRRRRGLADVFWSLLHWGRLKNSVDKYRKGGQEGTSAEPEKKMRESK